MLSGRFVDKSTRSSLIGVGIMLTNEADAVKKTCVITDFDGNFQFNNLAAGTYRFQASYIGYNSFKLTLNLSGKGYSIGVIGLEESAIQLKSATIKAQQIRVEQKGDTTQYHADGYKVNRDATAEDLTSKMPGITVDNSVVKAHGENVKRVLVDGQQFFGDDATLALRNLPAEVIDKVQVYDRLSDQAQFTGFDDGNSEKTINIVTKHGRNNGQFGKLYAGYGINNRYLAGGGLNFFNSSQRISIIGLSNNINQQNFSMQDLLGVTSGGRRFAGLGGGNLGGSGNNFLVGQQGGVNMANSLGLNYIDKWGKKINITGSYFYNKMGNTSNSFTDRTYFLTGKFSQLYNETDSVHSNNFNHRVNFRIEYNIDSANTIIFTPAVNFQNNYLNGSLLGLNTTPVGAIVSKAGSTSTTVNFGYNSSDNLLLRHKFHKKGRTISLNLGTSLSNQTGKTTQYSASQYFTRNDTTTVLDQQANSTSLGNTYSSNLAYTEPLTQRSLLQFNYSPSYSKSNSDKETYQYDKSTHQYAVFDSILSSKFNTNQLTQRGGLNYRLRGQQLNFMAGVNYQIVDLSGKALLPQALQVEKSFVNYMPMVMLNYHFSKNTSLRTFYRTSTNAPSISQLQNTIDNSNPLQLFTGNPDLKQEYTHTLVVRYNFTNPDKARTFFAFFSAAYTQHNIANESIIARNDTTLFNGIRLYKGSKFTMPVNIMEGTWNTQSLFTYGVPVQFFNSNLNFNIGGGSYNHTPGLLNNMTNIVNTYTLISGLVLGSNISEKIDFKLSYTGNYNVVKNDAQPEANNNYFLHTSAFKLNLLPWKGWVVNFDLSQNLYNGLGEGFNQSIFLWNGGVGYKFLKNRAADLRLNYFDLLNQNKSISRNVTESYADNIRTQVLKQYFMLCFTYNIRNFNSKA